MATNHVPKLNPKKKLTIFDIANSTIAQIGPAFSIFFGFGVIVAVSGLGSPLTLLLAALVVAIVGINLATFSKIKPTSGSMISYIGLTFGGLAGTTGAVLFSITSLFLAGSAFAVLGGWTSEAIQGLFGIHIPWIILTIFLTAIVWGLTVIGVNRSTKVASIAAIIEVTILLVVSVFVFIHPPSTLSFAPFLPSSLQGGLSGLALGFPLAIYLFIGFENSVALAEETENPQKNTPRAVVLSVLIMTVLYIFVSYSIIQGFSNDVVAIGKSTNPFVDLANRYLGSFSFLVVLAGISSTIGVSIACLNNFSRVLFNSSREGLIFRKLSHVSRWGTPIGTLSLISGLGLILVVGLGITGISWQNVFAYLSTLGTIPLLLIYILTNLSIIFYKEEKWSFVKRYVYPTIGVVSILIPLWGLVQPGQPAPVSYFPWIVLVLLLGSFVYAWFKVKFDPALHERIGSYSLAENGASVD